MTIRKGTIVRMDGSWMSGIGELVIDEQRKGRVERVGVTCENAQTVRSLNACFGNVIGEGHTINNETGGHLGKEIFFSVDGIGILDGFTPVESAPPEMVEEWEGGL